MDEILREEQAIWQDYLARLGSHLAYAGVVVRRSVSFGDPLAVTLATAQRCGADLIAVAAPAQPAVWRFFHPSLAQRLLAQSIVPVLLLPCSPLPRSGLPYRTATA